MSGNLQENQDQISQTKVDDQSTTAMTPSQPDKDAINANPTETPSMITGARPWARPTQLPPFANEDDPSTTMSDVGATSQSYTTARNPLQQWLEEPERSGPYHTISEVLAGGAPGKADDVAASNNGGEDMDTNAEHKH